MRLTWGKEGVYAEVPVKTGQSSSPGHPLRLYVEPGVVVVRADLTLSEATSVMHMCERLGLGWIPVSDQMPKAGRVVLIITDDTVSFGWCHRSRPAWYDDTSKQVEVTHWRPLPSMPLEV